MAHGAEQDGIAGLQQIDRARRHHAAPTEEVLAAPLEVLEDEGHVVLVRALFQNALGLRNDLCADAVAGDYGYCECLHGSKTIVAGTILKTACSRTSCA